MSLISRRTRGQEQLAGGAGTICLLVLSVTAWAQSADKPTVSLEVVPPSVELPGGIQSAQALVVVRNTSENSFCYARLSGWADRGLQVEIEEPGAFSIAPGEDHGWVVRVTPQGVANLPSKVRLRLDYAAQPSDDKKKATTHIALGELEVKPPHGETLESVAEDQVSLAGEAIDEQVPTQVYVVVTNKSNVPVQAKLLVRTPPFLEAEVPRSTVPLAPRQSIVLDAQLKARPQVRPGKYLVLFDVVFQWDEAGQPRERHVVSSHEITVGVFGESTVLALFGVPSVFLLPGFLVLLTFETLYRWGFLRPNPQPGESLLKVNAPAFWLLGITITGLEIACYAYFTVKIAGHAYFTGKNLLVGYGLRDIANLWIVSVVGLGLMGYMLYRIVAWLGQAAVWLWVRAREAYLARYIFTADDDPIMALTRLSRSRGATFLPRFNLGQGGQATPVFQLERPSLGRDRRWVGPGIVYSWTLQNSNLSRAKQDRLQSDLRRRLESRNDPKGVAKLLDKGYQNNALTYRWETVADIDGPREIEVTHLQQPMALAHLVTEEDEQ